MSTAPCSVPMERSLAQSSFSRSSTQIKATRKNIVSFIVSRTHLRLNSGVSNTTPMSPHASLHGEFTDSPQAFADDAIPTTPLADTDFATPVTLPSPRLETPGSPPVADVDTPLVPSRASLSHWLPASGYDTPPQFQPIPSFVSDPDCPWGFQARFKAPLSADHFRHPIDKGASSPSAQPLQWHQSSEINDKLKTADAVDCASDPETREFVFLLIAFVKEQVVRPQWVYEILTLIIEVEVALETALAGPTSKLAVDATGIPLLPLSPDAQIWLRFVYQRVVHKRYIRVEVLPRDQIPHLSSPLIEPMVMTSKSTLANPSDALAPCYLSAASANALISELRPTTLSPSALMHLNLVLDELLVSLLTAAESLNPNHLRLQGVPAVFSGEGSTGLRALGRTAVGEAELELRSWYEGNPSRRGFPPNGQGSGMRPAKGEFALPQAVELMRVKILAFSTLAPEDALSEEEEVEAVQGWKAVGGEASEETVAPAGLWITAIIDLEQSRNTASPAPSHNSLESRIKRTPPKGVMKGISSSTPPHERSGSVLSQNTKSMLGAFNNPNFDDEFSGSPTHDEEDFDALMASGETMKVSLTPSRIKSLDNNIPRKAVPSPTLGRSVKQQSPATSVSMPSFPTANQSPLLPHNLPPSTVDFPNRAHQRSTSLQSKPQGSRMLARAPTTIHEEEAVPQGRKQETFMDLLASDPPWKGEEPPAKGERTVPAIVLGTPPPPPPATGVPVQQAFSNRGDGEFRPKKPKNATRELADFFNEVPPPGRGSTFDDDLPPLPVSAKKDTKFKSFMSKVTGGKKKDDPTLSPSPSHSKLSEAGVRRKQSHQSVQSSTTLPMSYKQSQLPPPPLPTKLSHHASQEAMVRSIVGARSPDEAPVSPPSAPVKPATEAAPLPVPNIIPATPLMDETSLTSTVPPPPSTVDVRDDSSPRSLEGKERSLTVLPLGQPIRGERSERRTPTPDLTNFPVPPTSFKGLATEPSPSSAVSFQTAREVQGNGSEGAGSIAGTEKVATETKPEPVSSPSVPVADLIPLRHLLDHATTARECRMLLDAILSQFKVPMSTSDIALPSPEDRVTAWLLGGREGPASSSTVSNDVVTPLPVEGKLNGETSTLDREEELAETDEEESTVVENQAKRVHVRMGSGELITRS
ncbi:hypothetical protein P7C73_g3502, partial [Tremellales sp. Uapishka_1]